jgi:hypothetical protein
MDELTDIRKYSVDSGKTIGQYQFWEMRDQLAKKKFDSDTLQALVEREDDVPYAEIEHYNGLLSKATVPGLFAFIVQRLAFSYPLRCELYELHERSSFKPEWGAAVLDGSGKSTKRVAVPGVPGRSARWMRIGSPQYSMQPRMSPSARSASGRVER